MTFDEALELAHALAERHETRLGKCIFRDPLGEPPGQIWLLCFDIIDGPSNWCWMLSVGPGEPERLDATTPRPPAETFPYAQLGLTVPEALYPMSEGQANRVPGFAQDLAFAVVTYVVLATILGACSILFRSALEPIVGPTVAAYWWLWITLAYCAWQFMRFRRLRRQERGEVAP